LAKKVFQLHGLEGKFFNWVARLVLFPIELPEKFFNGLAREAFHLGGQKSFFQLG